MDVVSHLKENGSRSLSSLDSIHLIQKAYLYIMDTCLANPTNVPPSLLRDP